MCFISSSSTTLNLFIYLFMAVLGLRFCASAFSSCGKRGPLFIAVHGPLTIAACLVAEHRLQTRRLSNCGSWAQLLRGTWDLPRTGLEPVSSALAGRFSTTAPPGKALFSSFRLGFCFTLLIHCCWFFNIFIFPNKSFVFLILFYFYTLLVISPSGLFPTPTPSPFYFFFLLWFYFTLLQLFRL